MPIREVICLLLSCCGLASAVVVIPRPILDIEEVTSYSIILNWTMPPNELFSEFIVEMVPEEGDVMDYDPKDMRRAFINLTPGYLYTFSVRTVRQESTSDPVVIKQDTVPIVPSDLQLRTFDTLVLTLEGPYFGDAEFTVETHGVEATWEAPTNGASECYHSMIEDADGLKAVPGSNEEISRGDQLRQFINLTPGKRYRITVFSSTCGEGHLGELRSDGIWAEILVPPGLPPVVMVQEDVTTAELTWGEPEGSYDDFEIDVVSDPSTLLTVKEPDSPSDLGRNLTGLQPCTRYEVDVYTIFEGERSQSAARVVINTKPELPTNVRVADYTETSVTLTWDAPVSGEIQDYLIGISTDIEAFSRSNGTSVTFSDLVPGSEYTFNVRSLCRENATVTSFPSTITFSTKPNPPVLTTSECTYIGPSDSLKSLYEQVPWDTPSPSRMTVVWEKPTRGNWNNFLIDYSPYNFEEGEPSPLGPILLPSDRVSTLINVPVSGRVITVSVRTVSNNVYSDPIVQRVTCGGPEGEAVLRCKSYMLFWTIHITPIEGGTLLLINVPDFPIYNATVFMDDTDEVLVFFNNSFVIRNPCEEGPLSKITLYPRCPPSLPFCPVITRPICVHRRGRFHEVDGCCNSRLYDTNNEICCHSKLIRKDKKTSEECCATKWYDRKTHKCCGNGDTRLLSMKDDFC